MSSRRLDFVRHVVPPLVPNATVDDSVEALNDVADAAPDEISDDFQVLAGVFAEYAQAVSDAGVDLSDPSSLQDPEALEALTSLGETFNQEEVTQARDNIEAWFEENCAVAAG